MHRICCGLSKEAFAKVKNSDEPYLCNHCSKEQLLKELASLKAKIVLLETKVESQLAISPIVPTSASRISYSRAVKQTSSIPAAAGSESSSQVKSKIPNPSKIYSSDRKDRKFNVIVYGINEQPKGSPRHKRLVQDSTSIAGILAKIDSTIPEHSIQDCTRLGKYSDSSCRPIRVKMSRSCEVSSILSLRFKLRELSPHCIAIKPDLSLNDRNIDSILTKKRWELLQSGTSRHDIEIRGNAIFVRKVASVVNFMIEPICDQFSEVVSEVVSQSPNLPDGTLTSQPLTSQPQPSNPPDGSHTSQLQPSQCPNTPDGNSSSQPQPA